MAQLKQIRARGGRIQMSKGVATSKLAHFDRFTGGARMVLEDQEKRLYEITFTPQDVMDLMMSQALEAWIDAFDGDPEAAGKAAKEIRNTLQRVNLQAQRNATGGRK